MLKALACSVSATGPAVRNTESLLEQMLERMSHQTLKMLQVTALSPVLHMRASTARNTADNPAQAWHVIWWNFLLLSFCS